MKSFTLPGVTPSGKVLMRSVGLIASAISTITSSLGRLIVCVLAPYWRLKLWISNASNSAR